MKSIGVYAVKIVVANRSGIPDIICCYRGKFIAIEVKSQNGKLSKLQEYNQEKILRANGIVLVARSVNDVTRFFEECFIN